MQLLAMLVLVVGCHSSLAGGGGDDDDMTMMDARNGSGSGTPTVFDTATTTVIVEIDYEAGEQPYTGPILGFGDTFDPTVNNVDRLFAGKKKLTIPRVVGDMENVGNITDEELTVNDILALRTMHRDQLDATGRKAYYIIFVSGYFTDGNGPNTAVLGVSIGDTIAMFKDVIRSTEVLGVSNVVRYVEQSTLIHELAHSIGLVDNGVAMVANHKDTAHGAHCTNQDCVMFWLNEGASEATAFAQRQLLTGSTLLFDAQCLADVDALTGGR